MELENITSLKPECMPANKDEKNYIRGIAYTSAGYILPCCWLDNPSAKEELERHGLFDESLKVENNESIEDIICSDQWVRFIHVINHDQANAPSKCKRMCGYANN